jgi:hypothetical protein
MEMILSEAFYYYRKKQGTSERRRDIYEGYGSDGAADFYFVVTFGE